MRHLSILLFLLCATFLFSQAQQKKDFSIHTGNPVSVNDSLMNQGYIPDPLFLIKGKVAGASISKQGGHPDVSNQMVIRGLSSFFLPSHPVYVIDGVVGADPSLVFPEDIASIEVLKNVSESAKYGAFGGNGVVSIKTIAPVNNRNLKIGYSSILSFDRPDELLDLASAQDLRNYAEENLLIFEDGGHNVDWQDEMVQHTIAHSHRLALSGMIGGTGYLASLSYKKQPGIVIDSELETVAANFKVSQSAFKDRLKVDVSGKISNREYQGIDANDGRDIYYQFYTHNPTDPIYEADGETFHQSDRVIIDYYNPLAMLKGITNELVNEKYTYSIGLSYRISDGISLETTGSYYENSVTKENIDLASSYTSWSNIYTPYNEYEKTEIREERAQFSTRLKYEIRLRENHSISADVGVFSLLQNYKYNYLQVLGAFDEMPSTPFYQEYQYDLSTLESKLEFRTMAYSAQMGYNFKNRYFANFRVQRSHLRDDEPKTSFGEEVKSYSDTAALFPSVNLEWRISNEPFYESGSVLSYLALKLGYGKAGKQNNAYYTHLNMDLTYGIEKEWNSRLEFGFFNNRLLGSLTYYNRESSNGMMYDYNIWWGTYWCSDLEIKNSGIELGLRALVANTKKFRYSTSLQFSKNENEVTSLFNSAQELNGVNEIYTLTVGKPVHTFYVPDFVSFAADGRMLFLTENGGFSTSPYDAQRNKDTQVMPNWELGWSNNITLFNHWDIRFSFRYTKGHSIYNANGYFLSKMLAPDMNVLSESLDGPLFFPEVSDYNLEDASYIRLDNLVIGYTFALGQEKNNGRKLQIFVGGNNLVTITNYSGLDPEFNNMGQGVNVGLESLNVYPQIKSWFIGAKLDL